MKTNLANYQHRLKKIFMLIMLLFIGACTKDNRPDIINNKNHLVDAASVNIEIGYFYLKNKNFNLAKQKFLLALQQAPNNPTTYSAMGFFLESSGEKILAEKYYLQSIKIGKNNGAANNNYGAYLCRMGNYQQAIKHFLLAAQTINYLNGANAYKNAGNCALRIPDKKLAKFYFDKTKQTDPSMSLPSI